MAGAAPNPGDPLAAVLAALGYDERWIRYGFITPEMVRRQHADFLTGNAYCGGTEHLRIRASQTARLYRALFTDEEITNLVELIDIDPDPLMADSELAQLLGEPSLTDAQFDTVAAAAVRRGLKPDWIEARRVERLREAGKLDDAAVRAAAATGLAAVHEVLLSMPGLPRWALRELANRGANKAIRNRAGQMLNRGP